jgi:hypothetical protein
MNENPLDTKEIQSAGKRPREEPQDGTTKSTGLVKKKVRKAHGSKSSLSSFA